MNENRVWLLQSLCLVRIPGKSKEPIDFALMTDPRSLLRQSLPFPLKIEPARLKQRSGVICKR